jgi:hypothetical protein
MKKLALIATTAAFFAASPAAFAESTSANGQDSRAQQQQSTNPSMNAPHSGSNSNMGAPNNNTLRSGRSATDTPATMQQRVQPENETDRADPAITDPQPGQERTGNSQGNSSSTY